VTLLLLGGVAEAQRIAVVGPRGPGAGRVQRALSDGFEAEGLQLVADAEVEGAAADSAEGLAAALGALVCSGRTRRRGRSFVAAVTLHAPGGEEVASASFRGRSLGLLVRQAGRAAASLVAEARASGVPLEPPEPEPEPEPDPTEPLFDPEVPPDDDEEDADTPTEARALRIQARVGFLRRAMQTSVLVDPAARGMAAGAPIPELRGYESEALGQAQVGLGVEIYPGALLSDPVIPFLGFRFRMAGAPWLASLASSCVGDARCPIEPGTVRVRTKQREFDLAVLGRYAIGGHYLGGELGFGAFAFTFDRAAVQQLALTDILPSMHYRHVRLGLMGGVELVKPWLLVEARLAYLVGAGLGSATKEQWGTQSTARGGFDLGVEISTSLGMLVDGLRVGLYLDFTLLRARFRGQTACVADDPLQCTTARSLWEPWPAADGVRGSDVTGGVPGDVSDKYLRYGLSISYDFGGGREGDHDDDDSLPDESDDFDLGPEPAGEEPPPSDGYTFDEETVYEDEPADGGEGEELPPPLF